MGRSVWRMPEAAMRTRISSACTPASSTPASSNGAPLVSTTAAVMAVGLIRLNLLDDRMSRLPSTRRAW
jgi:hypothetical protein